jgi:hypothetical protein
VNDDIPASQQQRKRGVIMQLTSSTIAVGHRLDVIKLLVNQGIVSEGMGVLLLCRLVGFDQTYALPFSQCTESC